MKEQIEVVRLRDGEQAAREYAQRTLSAYRTAARYRNPETGKRHFAHYDTFRASFVRSMLSLRSYLRET